jgi:hypothetical protein
MSSRLFHTVVGLGIALGAQGVACLGGGDATPASDATEGGAAPSPSASGTAASDASKPDATIGAADGAATAPDSGASDAPRDVILDAFCDAAWPTTKANGGAGPTCGAVDACKDAGLAPHCFGVTAETPLTCDSKRIFPAWCVDGAWRCTTGTAREDACKCWSTGLCP